MFNGFGDLAGIQFEDCSAEITNRTDTKLTWGAGSQGTVSWLGGSLSIVDGTDADAGKRFMQLTLNLA